jgi:hypothetical protein
MLFSFGVRSERRAVGFFGLVLAFALLMARFGLLLAAVGRTPKATSASRETRTDHPKRLPGRHTKCRSRPIDPRDHARLERIPRLADARAAVRHRQRGLAVRVEQCERGDAGVVLADAGVVENVELRPHRQRVGHHARPSMRAGDDDGAGMLGPHLRDRVQKHESGGRHRSYFCLGSCASS